MSEKDSMPWAFGNMPTDAFGAIRSRISPIYFAKEENNWDYLRTDLDEERRCDGELKEDLLLLNDQFPELRNSRII